MPENTCLSKNAIAAIDVISAEIAASKTIVENFGSCDLIEDLECIDTEVLRKFEVAAEVAKRTVDGIELSAPIRDLSQYRKLGSPPTLKEKLKTSLSEATRLMSILQQPESCGLTNFALSRATEDLKHCLCELWAAPLMDLLEDSRLLVVHCPKCVISEKKESLVVAISKAKRFVDDLTALEKSTQEAMNLQCRFLEAAFDELHTEVLNVELVIIRVRDTVITARQIQRRLKNCGISQESLDEVFEFAKFVSGETYKGSDWLPILDSMWARFELELTEAERKLSGRIEDLLDRAFEKLQVPESDLTDDEEYTCGWVVRKFIF